MDRKPIVPKRPTKRASEPETVAPARKIDRLAEVVDLCIGAKRIAEELDEKLLSYLLAMAIQETRAGMRQEVSAAAGAVTVPPGPNPRATRARRGRGAG